MTRPEDLEPSRLALLETITKSGEVEMLRLSCHTEEGVMDVRNQACERLLAARVEQKLKNAASGSAGKDVTDILNRIHVSRPIGGVEREAFIPDAVRNKRKYDKEDPDRPKLERDIEAEEGGAGVYNVNLKKNYLLENPDWKFDKIPEIYDGRNVYDFIDPDIETKLAELEAEEERLQESGFYDEDEEIEDESEAEIRTKADYIREQRTLIRNAARSKKSLKNRAIIPRTKGQGKKLSEMEQHLGGKLGFDTSALAARARSKSRGRGASRGGDEMEVDDGPQATKERNIARAKSRARSTNRRDDGITNEGARSKAEKLAKLNQKKMNRMARQGESDRHTTAALPKHLVSSLSGFLTRVILTVV